MYVLRYIRLVLWGFFGVRRAGADDAIGSIRPAPLIVIAIVLLAGFILLLMWVASLAVEGLN